MNGRANQHDPAHRYDQRQNDEREQQYPGPAPTALAARSDWLGWRGGLGKGRGRRAAGLGGGRFGPGVLRSGAVAWPWLSRPARAWILRGRAIAWPWLSLRRRAIAWPRLSRPLRAWILRGRRILRWLRWRRWLRNGRTIDRASVLWRGRSARLITCLGWGGRTQDRATVPAKSSATLVG